MRFLVLYPIWIQFCTREKNVAVPHRQKWPFWGCFTGCFIIEMALLQIKNGVFPLMGLTFMHAFRLSEGRFLATTFRMVAAQDCL
jgi:hypothetical protein